MNNADFVGKTDEKDLLGRLGTLTPREREIMELYLSGCKGKEIVEKLGFTLNALKFHNKNIYGKLGVSSRKELLALGTLIEASGAAE